MQCRDVSCRTEQKESSTLHSDANLRNHRSELHPRVAISGGTEITPAHDKNECSNFAAERFCALCRWSAPETSSVSPYPGGIACARPSWLMSGSNAPLSVSLSWLLQRRAWHTRARVSPHGGRRRALLGLMARNALESAFSRSARQCRTSSGP